MPGGGKSSKFGQGSVLAPWLAGHSSPGGPREELEVLAAAVEAFVRQLLRRGHLLARTEAFDAGRWEPATRRSPETFD